MLRKTIRAYAYCAGLMVPTVSACDHRLLMCPSCKEVSVFASPYLAYRKQADALKLVQELLHMRPLVSDTSARYL